MNRIAFFLLAVFIAVTAYGPPPQTSNQIPAGGSGCGPSGCRGVGTTSTGCGPGGCRGVGTTSTGCGPGGCPGGAKKPYWWEGSTNPFKGCIPGTPGCKISSVTPVRGTQGRPGSVSSVHTVVQTSSSGCAPGTPGCPSKSYPDTASFPGQSGCFPGQPGCGSFDSIPAGHSSVGTVTTNIHSVPQTGCFPGQSGCAPQTVPISSGSAGHVDSGTITTNIHSVSQSGCAPGQLGCAPGAVPFDSSPVGHSGTGTVTTNIHSVSQPALPSGCRPGSVNCGPYEEDIGTDIVIDIVETPDKPIIQFPSHSVDSGSFAPGPTGSISSSIQHSSKFPQRPSSGSVHSVSGISSNAYPDSQSSGSFVSHGQSFPSQNQHQATSFDDGKYRPDQHSASPTFSAQNQHQATSFDDGQYRPDKHSVSQSFPSQHSVSQSFSSQHQSQSATLDDGQYRPEHHSPSGSFQSNVPGLPFRQGDINPQDLVPISTGVSMNGVSMMMMPMGMPLQGGICSAGSFCVQANTCNPYTGFIIRDVNTIAAVRRDQPQVPLLDCIIPARVLFDGVCCQEAHPIAGTGLD